jgi:hypothetical protein
LVAAPSPVVDTTIAGLGNGNGVTPPDTQLAVGPNDVIEMVNNFAEVWTRTGTFVTFGSLRSLFGVPVTNDGESDPRVTYDAGSGRFFASYASFQTAGTTTSIHIAWTTNSDPLSWFSCRFDDAGFLHDQPVIGVSNDKVAIGTNVFTWPAAAHVGSDTLVLDKIALMSSNTCTASYYSPDSTTGSIRPATSLSSTSSLFMASIAGSSTMAIWTLTGNPTASNVLRSRTNLSIASVSLPPSAEQPGTSNAIQTNDARVLDVVWKSGSLYVASNTGCVPTGDSAMRACARLTKVSTSGPSITSQATLGANGAYLYFPAIRPDASDNLLVVYSKSSSSTYAGVYGGLLDPTWSSFAEVQLRAGSATYTGVLGETTPYRWGDYSGAASDPNDSNSVWLAGEFAASSGGGAWSTFIAQMHAGSSPTITPTPTPTNTPAPPTATRTNTPVPTATWTNTPLPTATWTSTPVPPTATSTNTPTPCEIRRADINGDGVVNGLDLAVLAQWFLQTAPPAPAAADINGDASVDALDLAVLATWFTHSVSECP